MAAATREDVDKAAEALRRAPELDRLLLAPEEVVCLDRLVLRRWDGGRPPGAPLQHQQRLPLSAPLELGRQRQRRHRPAEARADHNRRVVGSRLGHWYLPPDWLDRRTLSFRRPRGAEQITDGRSTLPSGCSRIRLMLHEARASGCWAPESSAR